MRAYRFISKEWGLRSIKERRLKISRFFELNDPFEFFAINLADKDTQKIFKEVMAKQSEESGLLCFSKNWHNPLLWGHYADKHEGLCLGFDLPDKPLKHVNYIDERLELDQGKKITEDVVEQWISSKYIDWAYEDEVRAFPSLNDICEKTNHYYADFSDELQLKQVIVGCKSKITRKEIDDALGQEYKSVEKFKARAAFKKFKIVENKNSKLWK